MCERMMGIIWESKPIVCRRGEPTKQPARGWADLIQWSLPEVLWYRLHYKLHSEVKEGALLRRVLACWLQTTSPLNGIPASTCPLNRSLSTLFLSTILFPFNSCYALHCPKNRFKLLHDPSSYDNIIDSFWK